MNAACHPGGGCRCREGHDRRIARNRKRIAQARDWRARNGAAFDELYGPDPDSTLPWENGLLIAVPVRADRYPLANFGRARG